MPLTIFVEEKKFVPSYSVLSSGRLLLPVSSKPKYSFSTLCSNTLNLCPSVARLIKVSALLKQQTNLTIILKRTQDYSYF
jgi:hypothetical protein